MNSSPDPGAVAQWLRVETRAGRLPRRLEPASEARIASIVGSALFVTTSNKTKTARGVTSPAVKQEASTSGAPAPRV